MRHFFYVQLGIVFFATQLSAQFNTRWQTTHIGTSSGNCRLESNNLRVSVHDLYLDVEEEATIATVGPVGWGDSTTLEITGTFQLSPGSSVRSMLLWNGSTILKAKLKDRRSADSAYEAVVDRDAPVVTRRDPALIEYMGQNLYRFKIYPVAINKSRRIRILYTIPLSPGNGSMFFSLQPAFTFSSTVEAPSQVAMEFRIDTANHRNYVLECRNKKRDIQSGSVYLLPYEELIYRQYYWAAPSALPISIKCDSLKTARAYTATVDSGNARGNYIAVFSPVPSILRKAVENEKVDNYTIEALVSAGNKKYLVEVTDRSAVASYIKTEGVWDRVIAWSAYNADGGKIFTMADTVLADSSEAAVSMLPLLWGAKYSLKEGKGNLGAVYGFVDRDMSLLALESDSLSHEDAALWAEVGVPLLKPGEIKTGPDGMPATPRENIIIEYPSNVALAPADNLRICMVTVMPDGRLLISSDALSVAHRFTVTLLDLNGKVVHRQSGTVAGDRKITLQVARHIRGTFVVCLNSDSVKMRRMVTLR